MVALRETKAAYDKCQEQEGELLNHVDPNRFQTVHKITILTTNNTFSPFR